MAEHQVNPEAVKPPPWWEGKRFKKVAFFVGVPFLLWLMFRRTEPVPLPENKPAYQGSSSGAVTPKQVEDAQRDLLRLAADAAAKKEQLQKTLAAAAQSSGIKTDDLDLSTPQGQAELQNRLALARAAQANQVQLGQARSIQSGPGGGGESRADRLRKSLLTSAVVYVKEAKPTPPEPQTATAQPQVPQALQGQETTKAEEKKPKSLLDLPPEIVAKLTKNGDYRVLPQDTVVEAVLTNKLVGDAAGPVDVMLTTPIYAPGTHYVVFPAGTRILGEAASVGGFGESRMAVAFHRAIAGEGALLYSVSLDTMPALDQQGAVGLTGKVDQHILSTIAISGVIGAIGGLANIGNYSGNAGAYGGLQQFQSGVSQYMSQSAMQVLSRFINRRPNVEIPPGTRVKLKWVGDQNLPLHSSVMGALKEYFHVPQF